MNSEFKQKVEQKISEIEKICNLEIVAVISKRSSWLSYFLPKSKKLRAVEMAAHKQFVKHRISETLQRTGLLIYISKYEKAVYLLADEGITPYVPANEWAEMGAKLAEDFDHERAGETFLQALDLVARRIAPHFPPVERPANELCDRVRIEDS
ncbi:MAG: TPM domain-containing protein [Deltaproteobacteria bacterium]|nr:TPM domain-containing protein [Deltaproteobacteria bacterium]